MKRPSGNHRLRRAAFICLAAFVCVAAAGCGRKGPLEAHPDDPASRAASRPGAGAGESTGPHKYSLGSRNKALSSPIKPPDRPFVLDALL